MKKINAITREEEADLPVFENHDAALKFFEEKYGRRFTFRSFDFVGESKRTYFYELILDLEKYCKGRPTLPELIENQDAQFDYLFSFQCIEIEENGRVHILH